MPILATDALFAGGDSPAALADAARTGRRVALHPRLMDARGLPVFAAEVESIDRAALESTLRDPAGGWNDARKRTLALADMLATRMLEAQFDKLRAAFPRPAPPQGYAPTPILQLEWSLPPGFTEAERRTARDWLVQQLSGRGWGYPELEVTTTSATDGPAALQRLDDLICALHTQPSRPPCLLLAATSHIDERTIAGWDAAHRLFRAEQPEGRVPGEGACGVLLAPPPRAVAAPPLQGGTDRSVKPGIVAASGPVRPTGERAVMAYLHRLTAGRRPRPVDRVGRIDADTLQELAGVALKRAQLDAVAYVIADTDTRASRAAEALHLVEQILPEREPSDTLLRLGTVNGDCGAALALGAVAVAAHLTGKSQQPGLVLSNHDRELRCIAAITPASTDAGAPPGDTTAKPAST